MSAPESGRTSNSLEPLAEVIHTLINGAFSIVTLQMLKIVKCLMLDESCVWELYFGRL